MIARLTKIYRLSAVLVSLAMIIGMTPPTAIGASGSANFSLAASSSAVTVGDSVTITLSVAVSEFTAASLRVKMSYDSAKLQYVSEDSAGSAFPNAAGGGVSGGVIDIGRYTNASGTTTGGKVTALTFKTTAAGSAGVTFTSTKIYELATGVEKTSSNAGNLAIAIAAPVVPPAPTPTPTPTPAPNAPATTPTPTPQTTSAVKKVTPRPVAPKVSTTVTPSGNSTATPTPVEDPSAISAALSTVTFSKVSATPDGIDGIVATVDLRHNDSSVVSDIPPLITGLRPESDTSTEFVFDPITSTWSADISSIAPGEVAISVLGGDVVLANQTLSFGDSGGAVTPPTTSGLGSFGGTLGIGLIILLLLIAILLLVWRKLRHRNDDNDDSDDYSPDDSTPPASDQPTGYAETTAPPEEISPAAPDVALPEAPIVPPGDAQAVPPAQPTQETPPPVQPSP